MAQLDGCGSTLLQAAVMLLGLYSSESMTGAGGYASKMIHPCAWSLQASMLAGYEQVSVLSMWTSLQGCLGILMTQQLPSYIEADLRKSKEEAIVPLGSSL